MSVYEGQAQLTTQVHLRAQGSNNNLTNFYFSPPTALIIPPIPISDQRTGPRSEIENPQGYRLMKYFPSTPAGVNVWILWDGNCLIDQLPTGWPNRAPMMVDPVTGLFPTAQIGMPWPAEPILINSQGYISENWVWGPNGMNQQMTQGITQPVRFVFRGSMANGPLSYDEYSALKEHNFGAYITNGPPPANFPPSS